MVQTLDRLAVLTDVLGGRPLIGDWCNKKKGRWLVIGANFRLFAQKTMRDLI
jgi:hypothetical protein